MKIHFKMQHFSSSKLLWALSEIPPNFRFTKHASFPYLSRAWKKRFSSHCLSWLCFFCIKRFFYVPKVCSQKSHFHSNSLKCFIFFNDFSYKFTSFVRKTPDATTWFRIEKSGFFQYCPQNPHFWTFKKYNLIYFYKCKFLANLSLCGLGGFAYKCLVRFYLRVFHHFINKD